MQLDTKYTIPDTVMLQTIDDESLLLDTTTEEFFSLNEMGCLIWDAMLKHNDLNTIKEEFLDLYDVSSDVLTEDLLAFTQVLEDKGLLTIDA